MAHLLRFDGTNDYVEMSSVVTSPVTTNYELLRARFVLNALTANQCLAGHDGSNFIRVSESSIQVRHGGFDAIVPISPSLVTGELYDIRITQNGTGIAITNNDVQIGYLDASPRALSVSRIGAIFNASSFLNADLYLIDILNGTVVYDPSSSNGTGSVLPDSVGSNDGTLTNFPTDDSQWVFYVGPADTTPDQFALTAQTGVALSTQIESNTITVQGVDAATDIQISITGGEYAVSTDNGSTFAAWTSDSSNVQLGHQVKARVTSSPLNETQVSATLNIGGVTSAFNVTTVAANPVAEITASPSTTAPATTINYTVANAGPITQARLTRGTAALTLTSVTNTSAAVPALADNLPIIPFGAGAQLELWDGTEWLTAPIEFTQPVGQGVVTLAGTLNTTNTGFLFNYGGTPEVGDQFINANTDLTLAANGNITSDVDGTYTIYAIDVSDAQPALEAFTVTVAEQQVADTTPPVITLTGGNVTLTVGDTFTDPGYSATDDTDGNITANVVVTGAVDTSTAGTYTINYNVSDAAGNAATQVSRMVTVEAAADVTPPVITVSGQDTTTIAFGGTLPVFTASTDDGSTVVVSGDTPVNNVAGTYVIRYNATDAAGNQATEVTRTVIVQAEVIEPPTASDIFRQIDVSGSLKSPADNGISTVWSTDRLHFVVSVTDNAGQAMTGYTARLWMNGESHAITDGLAVLDMDTTANIIKWRVEAYSGQADVVVAYGKLSILKA